MKFNGDRLSQTCGTGKQERASSPILELSSSLSIASGGDARREKVCDAVQHPWRITRRGGLDVGDELSDEVDEAQIFVGEWRVDLIWFPTWVHHKASLFWIIKLNREK